MRTGIVLVHGYSGSADNLRPLATALAKAFGSDSIHTVSLPGHGSGVTPAFDKQAFIVSVAESLQAFQKDDRRIILIGHSTGGVIALAALAECRIKPALLVLASSPKKVDTGSLERWARHRNGREEIPFSSVANMVSLINAVGSRQSEDDFPVLVLQGDMDELVPRADADAWAEGHFKGPVRLVLIPAVGHDLFREANSALAVDIVVRAAADALVDVKPEEHTLSQIYAVEPEAERFIERSPLSALHLAKSPSGRTASDLKPTLLPVAGTEPIIANIELTTRCNLRCAYCARTLRGITAEDMPLDRFKTILGLLPHAYRITLVGLGETLLHPGVADFVAFASKQGRRVALVTNGMLLDDELSRKLLNAGLESIAFSLDGATQEIASSVRPGTDLDRVITNIKRFVKLSRSTREISTAVFSAVSTQTVSSLKKLMDVIADLGVHVMMLSDLNFRENQSQTLWKNIDNAIAKEVRTSVAGAFKKNLPVLSVRGLEEFGLWKRYQKYLLLPPDQLYQRSVKHAWCYSPWQTIPVNVRGDVTLCDCQPEIKAGNLLTQPLSEIWNGDIFKQHRSKMLSNDPPESCLLCPRF